MIRSHSTSIWLSIAFLFSAGIGIWLHHPAFLDHYRIADDLRQSMNWQDFAFGGVFKDDLLRDYAAMNRSSVLNSLYWLGSFFAEPVLLSKIFAVLFFSLSGFAFFYVAYDDAGVWGGLIALLLFTLVFNFFTYSVGGFAHGFMMPFIALSVLLIRRQRWKMFILLMPVEAITYPVAAVLTNLMLCLDMLILDKNNLLHLHYWREKAGWLLLAAFLTLVLLFSKYLYTPDWYGHIVVRSEMVDRIEFTNEGRYAILPSKNVLDELLYRLDSPYFLLSIPLFFLFVQSRDWLPDNTLLILLLSCIVTYMLADWLMLRLYIPSRYTRYGIPVFILLYMAQQYAALIKRFAKTSRRIVAFLLIIGIGLALEEPDLSQGQDTIKVRHQALYHAIKQLPKKSFIAAPAFIADNIPLYGERKVLFNYELAHPWITGYWRQIDQRIRDFYEAYFATDIRSILTVSTQYEITHWVIDREDFSSRSLRRSEYLFEPYNSNIRAMNRDRSAFVFKQVCRDDTLYKDNRFCIVDIERLIRFVEKP